MTSAPIPDASPGVRGARPNTMRAARGVLRAARSAAGYFNAILGGRDYARYVEHLRRNHPGHPVPTEREYWRDRYAAAERNPATRCC
ncbi:YbdD/YjiX family protein [Nocardia vaccinii]|uniref:YbdD/YjiX family protein n=1 Tax=Nocardia vaccinii TaxID=1822 RepID=UPI000ACFB1C5